MLNSSLGIGPSRHPPPVPRHRLAIPLRRARVGRRIQGKVRRLHIRLLFFNISRRCNPVLYVCSVLAVVSCRFLKSRDIRVPITWYTGHITNNVVMPLSHIFSYWRPIFWFELFENKPLVVFFLFYTKFRSTPASTCSTPTTPTSRPPTSTQSAFFST